MIPEIIAAVMQAMLNSQIIFQGGWINLELIIALLKSRILREQDKGERDAGK